MRKIIYFIVLLISTSAFIEPGKENYDTVSFPIFTTGELLEYKLNYGLFTVGKAQMKVHNGYYNINGRDCYRVDIFGKTSGAVDWVARINDNWGAYIDTAALVPHISYRKIEEGNYRKNELVKFDHETDMIEAKVVNNKTGDFKEPEYIQAPEDIRDIIGGLFYLRSLDFNNMEKGTIVNLNAFFEDTVYDFDIRFLGNDVVKTKAGKFKAIILQPIMPDNQMFAGENAITVWLSDDLNRIPLKAEANMVIGKATCELIHFEGLRN